MPEVKLEVDTKTGVVAIQISDDSGGVAQVIANADRLTELIRQLGKVRSKLVKATPPLQGEQIDAIFNTRWAIQPALVGEASVLSFQHPAFGPVGFVVPIDQVRKMIRILTAHVERADADRTLPKQ
jgi:hypothetical protein